MSHYEEHFYSVYINICHDQEPNSGFESIVANCTTGYKIYLYVYRCPDLLMVKTSQDGDLSSNDLREKRIVSRRGMERSRFLRSLRDLPWLRV